MKTEVAYDQWASTYDAVNNKTRDLEEKAIRSVIEKFSVEKIVEIGCGTGKNTDWLAKKTKSLIAVDFSEEMIRQAKLKIKARNITFIRADITKPWHFKKVNLITASLILEHIEDIGVVFKQVARNLKKKGLFYACELHPYKQLEGSRAKFEQDGKWQELDYYIHHISDYLNAGKEAGLICVDLREWFDEDDKKQTPRLVSFLFRKK